MDSLCKEEYELYRIKQAFKSIRSSAVLCSLLFIIRIIVLQVISKGKAFESQLWLTFCIIFLIIIIFITPVLERLINNCTLFTARIIHYSVMPVLYLLQITIPLMMVVSKIKDEFDKASAIIPFISMSYYLAANIFRGKFKAAICVISCVYTFYAYVQSNIQVSILSMFVRYVSGVSFGLLLIFSNEDDRKSNFMLHWLIQKKEEMYRHFLEAIPLKVIIFSVPGCEVKYQNNYRVDVDGESILHNQLGSLQEFQSLVQMIKNSKGEPLSNIINQYLRQDSNLSSVFISEYHLKEHNQKGRVLNVTILGPSLFLKQEIMGIMLEDVTEKRALEEERNATKYANALLCSLSHELKTPLNAVIGTLEQIEEHITEKPVAQVLINQSRNSALILNYTINSFLDFVKHQTGQLVLVPELTNIRELIKFVFQTCKCTIDHPISFEYSVDARIPDEIIIDSERVKLILVNLVMNAIKYTKHGSVKLEVDLKSTIRQKSKATFRVKDTGLGMSVDQVARLFKLNSRKFAGDSTINLTGQANLPSASSAKSKHESGGDLSGLGLTISQILCKAMDSRIKVKSHPGSGTIFWFSLEIIEPFDIDKSSPHNSESNHHLMSETNMPMNKIPDEEISLIVPIEKYHKSSMKIPRKHKPVVIIVDDMDLNRLVIKRTAEKYEVEIAECHNGKEAVKTFIDECIIGKKRALIFMDIEMPYMDGIEATSKIRQYKVESIPTIVAVTAYDTVAERSKCKNAKFDYFHPKPITANEIRTHIKNLIEESDKKSVNS